MRHTVHRREGRGTSCVKKYADSDAMRDCMRKRWMYSRLDASCGGAAWITTKISTGRKSSAPAPTQALLHGNLTSGAPQN